MPKSPVAEFRGTARFQVLRRLGQGGMGAVFAVHDKERDAQVALKTLSQMSVEGLLLFKNEFRALSDIHHENLVSLYELSEEKGQWFFTMEWVQGTDFISYVRPLRKDAPREDDDEAATSDLPVSAPPLGAASTPSSAPLSSTSLNSASGEAAAPASTARPAPPPHAGTLDQTRLRAALIQLGRGLCALHASGKIHRDIKPQNIVVTLQGRVAILDFGIVQDLDQRQSKRHQQMRGTALYMAPEQAGFAPLTAAADFYSVGVVLYQALTGRLPFYGGSEDVLTQKATQPPLSPRALLPELPADLCELCEALLAIDPAKRPTAEEFLARLGEGAPELAELAATPRSSSNPLIGREREFAALRDAFVAVRKGGTLAFIISGESGIGKSFLVKSFLDSVQADAPQVLVLHGRCYEKESVPYKAVDMVIDQMSSYLQILPDVELQSLLPPQLGALGAIFPVLVPLAERAGHKTGGAAVLDPRQQRNRAFAALRQIFAALSQRTQVVVAIDDLQWADADSLELIRAVLQPPDAPALLFFATQRLHTDPNPAQPKSALELPGEVRHLLLEKLTPADAGRLAERLLGRNSDAATAALVAAEAHGHPLFIGELARQRHLISKDQPNLRLDDALWLRIEKLESAPRRLLDVVAVAGVPIPLAAAARAAVVESSDVDKVTQALRSGHLMRTRGPRLSDLCEAYHDRVRESVVAHLAPAKRASLHGQLAVALEGSGDSDLELLMIHWAGAGQRERAAAYAEKAAVKAESTLAFEHAARLYEQTIELGAATGEKRRDFLRQRAVCLANCNRAAESARVFLQAADGADARTARSLQRRAAEQYLRCGHYDEGIEALRQVFLALGLSYPASPRRALMQLLLSQVQLTWQTRHIVTRPLDTISELDRERIETRWIAGHQLSTSDVMLGYCFQAQSLQLALAHGHAEFIALGLATSGVTSSVGGGDKIAQGRKLLARARELAKPQPSPQLEAAFTYSEGFFALFTGQWEEARAQFGRSVQILTERCYGKSYEIDFTKLMCLVCDRFLGDYPALTSRMERMLNEAEARSDKYVLAAVLCDYSPVYHLKDDCAAEARRGIEEGLSVWTRGGFHVVHGSAAIGMSDIDLYEGNGEAALARTLALIPKLKQAFMLGVSMLRHQVYYALGRAAVAALSQDGENSSRRKLGEDAARRLEKEKDAWIHPFGWLIRAGLLQLRGDSAAASKLWMQAAESLSALKMPIYAAAARLRAGQAQGGAEGERLVAESLSALRRSELKDPMRYAAMLAPSAAK